MSNESLLEALRREVLEEVNVRSFAVDALIATWDWQLPGGRSPPYRQFEFMATLSRPQEVQLAPQDFSDSAWVDESGLGLLLDGREKDDDKMWRVVQWAFNARRRWRSEVRST
jgi:8-oxo-dGTP pyrophosphatase MutT (NUDIX family)